MKNRREKFGFGTQNANYDFCTLLVNRGTPLKVPFEVNAPKLEDMLNFSLERGFMIGHEIQHWMQHQSYTIGAFFTLTRLIQENTLVMNLRNTISDPELARMIKGRISGVPIISFDQNDLLKFSDPSLSPQTKHLLEIWYYLWVVQDLFFDFSLSQTSSPPKKIVETTLNLCKDSCQNSNGSNTISKVNIKDDIRPIGMDNTPVSTRDLLESQAVIEELFKVNLILENQSNGETEEFLTTYHNNRLQNLINTSYLTPFKYFLNIMHYYNGSHREIYCTFLIILDSALNPPLPPYNLQLSETSWADLYPPYRFIKLIEAVELIGFYPELSLNNEKLMESYSRGLTDYAEITSHYDLNFEGSNLINKKLDELNNTTSEIKKWDHYFLENGIDSFSFLFWLNNLSWEFRKKEGALLFISPSQYLIKTHKFGDPLVNRLIIPPLQIRNHTELGRSRWWPGSLGPWLIQSNAIHYFTYDFMMETGPPDLSTFNNEYYDLLRLEEVSLFYQSVFGMAVW